MYRAAAWYMLRNDVDLDDPGAIAAKMAEASIDSGTDPAAPTISVNGIDVSAPIREDDVTAAVSRVSAVPAVRAKLADLQRAETAKAAAGAGGIVVEGRDIATAVLPDADVKVFLTADQLARASRRAEQDQQAGRAADVVDTASALAARDAADSSRQASPLQQAPDAQLVDATFLTLPEVIDTVLALVADNRKELV